MKPILCLDFDGVVHSYTSGWQGACIIPDPVVPGFFEWVDEIAQHFKVVIFSSRSHQPGATDAMALWLGEQRRLWRAAGGISPITDGAPVEIEFVENKPPAIISIDDRALTFTGEWPALDSLMAFKPWNKK